MPDDLLLVACASQVHVMAIPANIAMAIDHLEYGAEGRGEMLAKRNAAAAALADRVAVTARDILESGILRLVEKPRRPRLRWPSAQWQRL
jgi:hypothetical protein